MPHRSPSQLALRRRIESVIGIAAPFLDVLLFAADKVSHIAGRNDLDPEPARRVGASPRRSIGGPPEGDVRAAE